MFVALVLIYISVPNAYRSTLMGGERSILQTPFNPPYVWWFRWIIPPLSGVFIVWQNIVNIIAHIRSKPEDYQA